MPTRSRHLDVQGTTALGFGLDRHGDEQPASLEVGPELEHRRNIACDHANALDVPFVATKAIVESKLGRVDLRVLVHDLEQGVVTGRELDLALVKLTKQEIRRTETLATLTPFIESLLVRILEFRALIKGVLKVTFRVPDVPRIDLITNTDFHGLLLPIRLMPSKKT